MSQSLPPNQIVTRSGAGVSCNQRGVRITFWLSVVPPMAGLINFTSLP